MPSFEALDHHARDAAEAEALYELLEQQIVPLWADREGWWNRVRHGWTTLGPNVTASRMVRDYVEQLYEPAGNRADRMAAANFAPAAELAAWKQRIIGHWTGVRIADLSVSEHPNSGSDNEQRIAAKVDLSGLDPSDVMVEAWFGRLDLDGEISAPTRHELRHDGGMWTGSIVAPGSGEYGVAVRVVPTHQALAHPTELGLARYAT